MAGFAVWLLVAVLALAFFRAMRERETRRAARRGRSLELAAARRRAAETGRPLVYVASPAGLLADLRARPDDSAVFFEDGALEEVPGDEIEAVLRELCRAGEVFAAHGAAVDSERYALTGARQPVRLWEIHGRIAGGPARVFTAYPPHDGFRWTEFSGASRTPVARHLGLCRAG